MLRAALGRLARKRELGFQLCPGEWDQSRTRSSTVTAKHCGRGGVSLAGRSDSRHSPRSARTVHPTHEHNTEGLIRESASSSWFEHSQTSQLRPVDRYARVRAPRSSGGLALYGDPCRGPTTVVPSLRAVLSRNRNEQGPEGILASVPAQRPTGRHAPRRSRRSARTCYRGSGLSTSCSAPRAAPPQTQARPLPWRHSNLGGQ